MSLVKGDAKQERWRSWVVWTSIAGALLMLAGHLGLYEKTNIDQTTWQTVIDTLLTLLVSLGVLNNPTNAKDF